MLRSDEVFQDISVASRDYCFIKKNFSEFVSGFRSCVNNYGEINIFSEKNGIIKGVSVVVPIGKEFFTVSVAGRTVRFVLSAKCEENYRMVGEVQCFLVPNLLSDRYHENDVLISKFDIYVNRAVGDVFDEDDNLIFAGSFLVDERISSLKLVLHIIRVALAK